MTLEPRHFDVFSHWLQASGYSLSTTVQYVGRVKALTRKFDVASASPLQRQVFLDSYSASSRVGLLTAYGAWRKWIASELPGEAASWPSLDAKDGPVTLPDDVLAAVGCLYDVLGVTLLQQLTWEQVDLDAGVIYGRVAGAVVRGSLLARGDRVRSACAVLRDWSLGEDEPGPTWPVVVIAPGSLRHCARSVLARWRASIEAPGEDAVGAWIAEPTRTRSTPDPVGPMAPKAPAPPIHLVQEAQAASEASAASSTDPEALRATAEALRGALGREPTDAEVQAALGEE